jgi:hypothetical protein
VPSALLFIWHKHAYTAQKESDVDILVDFPGSPTSDQHMGLKIELEDLLGRRVDLVTRRGLREGIRPACLFENSRCLYAMSTLIPPGAHFRCA